MECCPNLFISCEDGCIACTKRFIQLNNNLSLKDEYGWTPLHLATNNNHLECITLLLDNGALIDKKDEHSGSSALHFACSEGNIESVQLLLKYNASIQEKTDNGWTPLHYSYSNNECMSALINNEVSINSKDNEGSTPLHLSVANGYLECADILLKHGASINDKDHDGNTPLHYACINRQSDCIKLLLQYNVDINVQNTTGVTPLHFASGCFGKILSVRLLLEAGADCDLRDDNGKRAIDHTINDEIRVLIQLYEELPIIKGAIDES